MDYKNWYAISIQMNKERVITESLRTKKEIMKDTHLKSVEYLQRKELVIEKSGKRRVKNRLLMSGYVLVQVTPEVVEHDDGSITHEFPGDTFNLILSTPGVKFFVNCDKDHPIAFRPREIKKLFDLCDESHLEVKDNLLADYQEGDRLDVIDGPFAGYQMEVSSIQGDKILGQIEIFDRTVPAEFTKEQLYKQTKHD